MNSQSPFWAMTIRTRQSSLTTATQYPVRSIGAASRGGLGGPAGAPPRPPRWACMPIAGRNRASAAAATSEAFRHRFEIRIFIVEFPLPEGFAFPVTPGQPIRWAEKCHQSDQMVVFFSAGIPRDDDLVARFEALARNVLAG